MWIPATAVDVQEGMVVVRNTTQGRIQFLSRLLIGVAVIAGVWGLVLSSPDPTSSVHESLLVTAIAVSVSMAWHLCWGAWRNAPFTVAYCVIVLEKELEGVARQYSRTVVEGGMIEEIEIDWASSRAKSKGNPSRSEDKMDMYGRLRGSGGYVHLARYGMSRWDVCFRDAELIARKLGVTVKDGYQISARRR